MSDSETNLFKDFTLADKSKKLLKLSAKHSKIVKHSKNLKYAFKILIECKRHKSKYLSTFQPEYNAMFDDYLSDSVRYSIDLNFFIYDQAIEIATQHYKDIKKEMFKIDN